MKLLVINIYYPMSPRPLDATLEVFKTAADILVLGESPKLSFGGPAFVMETPEKDHITVVYVVGSSNLEVPSDPPAFERQRFALVILPSNNSLAILNSNSTLSSSCILEGYGRN